MELQTMVQLERKLAAAFDTEFNWRNGTIVLHGVEVEFEVWDEYEFATVILKHESSRAVMCAAFDTGWNGLTEDTTVFELAYFNWLARIEDYLLFHDEQCFLLSASIDAMLLERSAFYERCRLDAAVWRLARLNAA